MNRVLLTFCFFIANEATTVEIIAHRGYSCGTLENTVRSVGYAWLAGADAVEVDLRVSRDGVIFLHHDDNVNGITIAKSDYAEIASASSTETPVLSEVLGLGEPPGHYVLDLKEVDPEKYRSLPSLIAESDVDESRFWFQSASIETLVFVKGLLPNSRFFYLSHLKRRFPLYRAPKPQSLIASIEGYGFDGVSLKGRQFLDRRFVKEIIEAGYDVNIWTINDPGRAQFYRDIGVSGIITDAVEDVRSQIFEGEAFEGPCLSSAEDAG